MKYAVASAVNYCAKQNRLINLNSNVPNVKHYKCKAKPK
jgi:hypothetical protein